MALFLYFNSLNISYESYIYICKLNINLILFIILGQSHNLHSKIESWNFIRNSFQVPSKMQIMFQFRVWFISSSKSRRFVAIDEWSIPNFAISTWSTKISQNRFNDGREWLSAGQRAVGGWNKVVLFLNSSNNHAITLNRK